MGLGFDKKSQNSVPVVLGGLSKDDYTKLLPPHSFINIEDFPSVSSLADYLVFLGNNSDEYNKYHAWREEYQGM